MIQVCIHGNARFFGGESSSVIQSQRAISGLQNDLRGVHCRAKADILDNGCGIRVDSQDHYRKKRVVSLAARNTQLFLANHEESDCGRRVQTH